MSTGKNSISLQRRVAASASYTVLYHTTVKTIRNKTAQRSALRIRCALYTTALISW